jgi:DNA (cytosine-5)-methyltransferase 1
VLWWQISDILQTKKASFVLLENVDRLLKSPAAQRGRDFGVMLSCLNRLGYCVEWRVINAAEYGAAQRRRRTFIFAYHKSTSYSKKMISATNLEIISKKGFFAATFPIEPFTDARTLTLEPKEIWEISETFKFDFGNAGFMRDGKITTLSVVPIKESPIPLRDILENEVPDKYYLGENLEKWAYLKGSKHVLRTSKSGHSYNYSEGPIAFPDPIDLPARTMLTSESSLNRSTHVIPDSQNGKLRLLTPLETERIQGFEDNWTNTGMPEKTRYFCMGNALVVPMVTRMGKTLNKIFEEER